MPLQTVTVLLALLLVALALPMILGLVPPNRFYGFRTRRTLEDPTVWYPANRFAGWAMAASGVVVLATALALSPSTLERSFPVVVLVPSGLAVVASLLHLRRL